MVCKGRRADSLAAASDCESKMLEMTSLTALAARWKGAAVWWTRLGM